MKKASCVLIFLIICFIPLKVKAQIKPDQSLPVNSQVIFKDNTFVIEGGTAAGNNLFHSFEEFSVPKDTTAWFNNPAQISHIFSRITGQSPSFINGVIKSNPAANLFFINPNGIIFGPNASINVGASFIATTANQVYFADGTIFDARSPQPLLTISVPIGLGFGTNPSSIISEGTNNNSQTGLQVPTGKTLALVGGEIRIDGGHLSASSGRIELGSVDSNNQVNLRENSQGYQLEYQSANSFQDIYLTNLALVDASGVSGGAIHLQGRNIIISEGSKITSNTLGNIPGQPVTINASQSVQVLGTTNQPGLFEPTEQQSGIFVPLRSAITTTTFGDGNAGDLTINTRELILKDGGQITANSFGRNLQDFSNIGQGGQLVINASDSVEIIGTVPVSGEGRNPFNPERIFVEVGGSSSIGTVTGTVGQAGNLTINTNQLIVRNGGVITSNTFGIGKGGNLMITAKEIELQGTSPNGIVPSIITASSITLGDAGNITINADQLLIREGAILETSALGFANAGNIFVNINNLTLNQGALSATTTLGEGGNISILAQEALNLRNNSIISTEARGTGNGGNININAQYILATPQENSDIIANANQGRGGNILITTQGIFGIEARNNFTPLSDINASSEIGIDGTIQINRPDFEPQDQVSQNANSPENPTLIAGCQGGGDFASRFVNIGRGGLRANPTQALSNQEIWEDITPPSSSTNATNNATNHDTLEAQGWLIDAQGRLILTASVTKVAFHANCGNRE